MYKPSPPDPRSYTGTVTHDGTQLIHVTTRNDDHPQRLKLLHRDGDPVCNNNYWGRQSLACYRLAETILADTILNPPVNGFTIAAFADAFLLDIPPHEGWHITSEQVTRWWIEYRRSQLSRFES